MTVETTIQRMFDEYPDLFSTRQECYDFLFCVIGNGYEWRRGQLVYCDDESTKEEEEEDYACPFPPLARQSEENIAKRRKEDEELHNLQRENDLEDGLPDIGPYDPDKRHWYHPICEYSRINNVPKDVKPDWAKAVDECKAMLKADGIEI